MKKFLFLLSLSLLFGSSEIKDQPEQSQIQQIFIEQYNFNQEQTIQEQKPVLSKEQQQQYKQEIENVKKKYVK